MKNLRFIFVHGLSGWGSYDSRYRRMPYWGMRGGDLIAFLREKGFSCFAASVSPAGSAWDRACELYAQIAGTRVDYGAAHSEEYRHARFGADFSGRPLIPDWGDGVRLALLGHSFGGAAVRVFSHLLSFGDAREASAAAGGLSPLFRGGLERRVHSVTALASPLNGTTAYDMFEDPDFDPGSVKVPLWSRALAKAMSLGTRVKSDGRDARDTAAWDMHLDRAKELNAMLPTLPGVFYFSVPCSFTVREGDGTYRPRRGMEPLFAARSRQIGSWSGATAGGMAVDESWRENDGLVNTVSAGAPIGAPAKPLDRDDLGRGIWNVFPTLAGDHMWLQGGLLRRHDVRAFYTGMLSLIESAGRGEG